MWKVWVFWKPISSHSSLHAQNKKETGALVVAFEPKSPPSSKKEPMKAHFFSNSCVMKVFITLQNMSSFKILSWYFQETKVMQIVIISELHFASTAQQKHVRPENSRRGRAYKEIPETPKSVHTKRRKKFSINLSNHSSASTCSGCDFAGSLFP